MADTPARPNRLGSHHIRVLARRDDNGEGTWLGVGVCRQCEPAEGSPRKTFSAGQPCPRCGADGDLEWRWWPESLLPPSAAKATSRGQSRDESRPKSLPR